jgi:hypothetical protein
MGRSASVDGVRTRDCRTNDLANKRLIASYHGHEFSAERADDGSLHIYQHGDDTGTGVRVVGGTQDGASIAQRLQNTNAANKTFWEKRNGLQ